MNTSPASGRSSPAITRRSVDLPLPLGPRSAVSEPLSTTTETSSSATKSPNRLVTLRASIATDLLLRSEQGHQQQRRDGQRRKQHRESVSAARVEVVVGGLDAQRQRFRAPRDAARDDADRAELT